MERLLINYCSPTLASLKTANLFSFSFASDCEMTEYLSYWNGVLEEKGISLTVLQINNKKALIYVFRRTKLEKDLMQEDIARFLTGCGYCDLTVENAIHRLRQRFDWGEEFPHEIGLFPGYPLEDVKGYIENKGKNSKMGGFWKVYCDEYKAAQMFAKFEKCRNVYIRLFQNGRSVMQLTVAA